MPDARILPYVRGLGDYFVSQQQPSGNIPAWLSANTGELAHHPFSVLPSPPPLTHAHIAMLFTHSLGCLLFHFSLTFSIPTRALSRTLIRYVGEPAEAFKNVNAETAGCALFLAELYSVTQNQEYLAAAKLAMQFVEKQIMPRQKWFGMS